MKKIIFFILLTTITLYSFGQSNIESDSIRLNTQQNEKSKLQPGDSKENKSSNISIEVPEKEKAESNNQQSSDSIIKRLNLYTPKFYVGPGDNPQRIATSNIFENEYTYFKQYPINSNSGFTTISSLNVYPGMGAVSNISGSYYHQPVDWLSISLGTYVSKQQYYLNSYNDIGLNSNFKFYLNDRFRINLFGQYSFFGNGNDIGSNASGLYPQSLYGTSLEYKINEKFGIQGGFVRELDPMTGKWENRPFIAPVFYNK